MEYKFKRSDGNFVYTFDARWYVYTKNFPMFELFGHRIGNRLDFTLAIDITSPERLQEEEIDKFWKHCQEPKELSYNKALELILFSQYCGVK